MLFGHWLDKIYAKEDLEGRCRNAVVSVVDKREAGEPLSDKLSHYSFVVSAG
jgi:hypothetical protein